MTDESRDEFSKDLARRLLTACQEAVGPGFHPDTRATEYADAAGEPTMDAVTAHTFQLMVDYAFAALGDDVYELALDAVHGDDGPRYASFAYGTSRSGKTTYHSVVLLRPDLGSPDPDLAMMQGFLFAPSQAQPLGLLNAPHTGHRARVGDVQLAIDDWAKVDAYVAKLFTRLVRDGLTPFTRPREEDA